MDAADTSPPVQEHRYYVSAVHPDIIQSWRDQIAAMPPRKRDKWHVAGLDSKGVLRLTRCVNGHFQVKIRPDTGDGKVILPTSGWAPIAPIGGDLTRQQLIDTYGLDFVENMERGTQGPHHINNPSAWNAGLTGGVFALNREVQRVIAQNRTGNHYRNKSVAIPTRAGEPVRG